MIDKFFDPKAPVQPDQFAVEFLQVLSIFDYEDPQTVVEIGTREGGTLYQWMKHLWSSSTKTNQQIIAIDLPGARWGTRKKVDEKEFYEWANKFNVRFDFVKGNSHHPSIISRVDSMLENGIDWLFIDGDHTMLGLIQDLTNYLPMCNRGATIVIHDVVPDISDSLIQIHQLFPLLEVLFSGTEVILSTEGQTSRGLGVIRYYG